MSPVPAVGVELTPSLPWGCPPGSEQILRAVQLLKESFCCYSAFPYVCGAAQAPPRPGPGCPQGCGSCSSPLPQST